MMMLSSAGGDFCCGDPSLKRRYSHVDEEPDPLEKVAGRHFDDQAPKTDDLIVLASTVALLSTLSQSVSA